MIADKEKIRVIYELAAHPEQVDTTEQAWADIWRDNDTVDDICDSIRDYIEDPSKLVIQDVTRSAKGHVGKTIYILEPVVINRKKRYVKVGLEARKDGRESLIIISAHRSRVK